MATAACLPVHIISHRPVFAAYRVIALEISTCKLRHMLCDRTDLESATGTHDDTNRDWSCVTLDVCARLLELSRCPADSFN